MSFQDYKRAGNGKRPVPQSPRASADFRSSPTPSLGVISDRSSCTDSECGSVDMRAVSQLILRYQKEVGSLPQEIHGGAHSSASSQSQIQKKLEGAKKVGERIEGMLLEAEDQLKVVPKHQASEQRAAIVKLTRDFRRIETMFKTMELEHRKKAARQKQQLFQAEQDYSSGAQNERGQSQLHNDEQRQIMLRQEEQERFAVEIMKQREDEVKEINRKMHQVNEIYKDLGQIVSSQQDQIDQVEEDMENAVMNTNSGLKKVEAANTDRKFTNPFGKKKSQEEEEEEAAAAEAEKNNSMCNFGGPFETIAVGLQDMRDDFATMGQKMSNMFAWGQKSGVSSMT